MNTTLLSISLLSLTLPLPAQDAKPVPKQGADQAKILKGQDGQAKVQKKSPKKKTYKVPFALGAEVDPAIQLRDLSGKKHKLGDLRGKVVFIHFYSTRCPYEKAAIPKINKISASYSKKGVVVLGIAANVNEIGKRPAPKAFKAKKSADRPYANLRRKTSEEGIDHPILVDHDSLVANKFQARTTPHSFVIDGSGILRYAGALDNDARGRKSEDRREDYVRLAIDAALKGRSPEVTKTRPYG